MVCLQRTICSKSINFNFLRNSSALVPSLFPFNINSITARQVIMTTSSTYVLYHYTPNLPCAILLAALFGLTTALHLYQRIKAHAKYFNPFIVGGICQSRQSIHKLFDTVVAFADNFQSSNHRLWGSRRLSLLYPLHDSLRNLITPNSFGANAVRSVDIHGPRSNHLFRQS